MRLIYRLAAEPTNAAADLPGTADGYHSAITKIPILASQVDEIKE